MRTQLKFAASIIPKTTNVCDRIGEVAMLKTSLVETLIDGEYRFAIVDDAVLSSEINSLTTINFVISVVSQTTNLVDQTHEDIDLQKKISSACSICGHRCAVIGEDKMSDHILNKAYGLPINYEGENNE